MSQVNIDEDNFHRSKLGPLRLVVLQSGSFCNLNCDYCYLPDRHIKNFLCLDLIAPIFSKLLTSPFIGKSFTVCWHLGEPLAVPLSFYEKSFAIIDNVKANVNEQVQINYSVQTNGLLINQNWCDFFLDHNFNVGVSLDGPAFIHDAHRQTRTGIGSHEATMRGIRLLQQNNLDFHVIAVITEASLECPDEIFKFFLDNGIKRVGFNIEEVEGVNQTSSLQKPDIAKKVTAFWQRFWELTVSNNQKLQVREFENLSELIFKAGKPFKNEMCQPFSIISIDTQGNFSTYSPELLAMKSIDYGEFILGNILEDSWQSVCNSPKFINLDQDITSGLFMCKDNCQYFNLCGGGAPSNKYWENGTFICAETMACQYNKKIPADVVLEGIENRLGLNQKI